MKDPRKMTTDELIELADRMKKGMTLKMFSDIDKIRMAKSHAAKQPRLAKDCAS